MFGLNDNNNLQNGQNHPTADGQTPNAPAPVHGPFSSLSPGGNNPSQSQAPINDISPPQPPSSQPPAGGDELLDIKQRALANLTPLVSHLEQSPEEKFKTTMMLIQASDDPKLLSQAHEAANQIEDEKIRAQALLDVVNEINYFTHQSTNTPNQPAG